MHRPFAGLLEPPAATEESGEGRFRDRPCYVFNRTLPAGADDRFCMHCQHYLTARCPHIDEFLDDVEELGPE
ncbi:MAG: hypothetical protein ACYDFT_09010 [Thermoplasmata archaeon]